MKQVTGYPVIDEILDSLRPQAQPSTRTAANDRELALDELAFELCYQSIRYSDLWPHLENDAWDALAERLRAQVRTFVEGEIDAELTRLEAESEKVSNDD